MIALHVIQLPTLITLKTADELRLPINLDVGHVLVGSQIFILTLTMDLTVVFFSQFRFPSNSFFASVSVNVQLCHIFEVML